MEGDTRSLLPNDYRAHAFTLGIFEFDAGFGYAGKSENDQNNRQCDGEKSKSFHKSPHAGIIAIFARTGLALAGQGVMSVHRDVEYTSEKFEILSGKVQSWR